MDLEQLQGRTVKMISGISGLLNEGNWAEATDRSATLKNRKPGGVEIRWG